MRQKNDPAPRVARFGDVPVKLIFCTLCHDVIALRLEPRICHCGASSGRYDDPLNATITGPCVPLGFENRAFFDALDHRPKSGLGQRFEAFVIPVECETVKHV